MFDSFIRISKFGITFLKGGVISECIFNLVASSNKCAKSIPSTFHFLNVWNLSPLYQHKKKSYLTSIYILLNCLHNCIKWKCILKMKKNCAGLRAANFIHSKSEKLRDMILNICLKMKQYWKYFLRLPHLYKISNLENW